MDLLKTISNKVKLEVITELLSNYAPFTLAEIEQGVIAAQGDIDTLLIAALRTPNTEMLDRARKAQIISRHLGAEIMSENEIFDAIFMEPTNNDMGSLFVLVVHANKEKVDQALAAAGSNDLQSSLVRIISSCINLLPKESSGSSGYKH
jgi:hypothetical protein